MRYFLLFLLLLLTVPAGAQQQFTPYPTPVVQFESDPLTAPSLSLNYTGASGQTTFWYRVIATFPRGQGPSSAPVTVTMSGTPTASNPVRLSWATVPGATSYFLIRTSTVNFSGSCSSCLVASGNITSAVDNGGALSSFTHSPVGVASGVLELNNRDYATAKFELSYPLLNTGGGVPVDLGLGDLSDVTLTSPVQNDVLVKSAGDWLNTNLLTAIGGAGLTNGRVPYTASGALTDSTRLQYDGGRMLLTADGSSAPLQFTGSNTTNLRMIDSTNLGAGTSGMRFGYAAGGFAEYGNSNIAGVVVTSKRMALYQVGTSESQPNIQFWVNPPHADGAYVFMKGAGVNPLVRINASAFTMRVSDETATTGDTELIVKEGAGQASASFQVVDNSDGELFSVNSGGGFGGPGRALANLGTPNDGTIEYCTDCLKGSDPCSASSTGAMAMRVNGAWQCM